MQLGLEILHHMGSSACMQLQLGNALTVLRATLKRTWPILKWLGLHWYEGSMLFPDVLFLTNCAENLATSLQPDPFAAPLVFSISLHFSANDRTGFRLSEMGSPLVLEL